MKRHIVRLGKQILHQTPLAFTIAVLLFISVHQIRVDRRETSILQIRPSVIGLSPREALESPTLKPNSKPKITGVVNEDKYEESDDDEGEEELDLLETNEDPQPEKHGDVAAANVKDDQSVDNEDAERTEDEQEVEPKKLTRSEELKYMNLPPPGRVTPGTRLMLLFTTFKNTTSRDIIQENTIRNWATFLPAIQPVAYLDLPGNPIATIAVRHGWIVRQIPAMNSHGTPIFKHMFVDIYRNYPGYYFYGFANGDILFDHRLRDTLEAVKPELISLNKTLIIGSRRNYWLFKNETGIQPSSLYAPVRVSQAGKHASLFRTDAEDYMFLSYHGFNWTRIKPVVIGRPGYDNYFVSKAIYQGHSVIDASKTILALHQTGPDGGQFSGAKNKDSRYNIKLIKSWNYQKGSIPNAQYLTKIKNKRIVVFPKSEYNQKRDKT